MVTGKTAAEEWDDSSSVVSSAERMSRFRGFDSRVNHVEHTLNGEQNAPEDRAGNLNNQRIVRIC
ncbi:hypothetical protein RvY_05460 [Ramazzottius varieornatus]|uniref:Uncharacterized protein n=1 Tax=Ramazzottius varieornatus TaxID=947166 RepID=A0A1D1UV35_RAMVA|nr:hypothetical protein RvY_05460 [Ramazzottius varieornatus]